MLYLYKMEKVLLNNNQLELINNDLYMTDQRFDDLKVNTLAVYGQMNFADLSISNNLTIEGNLTVNGTQTIINTESIQLEDPIITLNKNSASVPTSNSGIEIERGDNTNARMIWNETTDKFQCGIVGNEKSIAVLSDIISNNEVLSYNAFTNEIVSNVGFNYSASTLTTPDIKVNNLSTNSLVTTDTNKKLITNTGLNYSSNLLTAPDVTVSNLTTNSILTTDENKKLVTNAGLTYASNTLTTPNIIATTSMNCYGNLGIGTTSASAKLHLDDTTNDAVIYSRATNIKKNSILRLHANYDSIKANNGNAIIQLGTKISDTALNPDCSWYFGTHSSAGTNDFDPPLKIGFKTGSWGVPGEGDFLTILTNGNLGIGTTSPSSKLHVAGSQIISNNLSVGTTSQIGKLTVFSDNVSSSVANGIFNNENQATIYLRRTTTDQTSTAGSYYGASIFFGDNVGTPYLASGIAGVQTGSTIATDGFIDDDHFGLAFFCHSGVGSGSVIQETMRIAHDGKIGIATTTPSSDAILDINSTTLAVRIPRLTTTSRNSLTTEGLLCYDSTLKAPVFRNNLGWVEQRNILEELYYNISVGTTSSTLTNSTTDYRLSTESSMTSVPSTNNLFTNNGSSFVNWKYIGTNLNTRYFKYMLKISFFLDSASEKLTFSVYKNATFSGNTYSSGGTVLPSSYNQIHSSPTSGQSSACEISFIDITATDDVYTLVCRYGNSGKKLTINHCNVICETYY